MRRKTGYVYIMANKLRTVLYIGVTSNLYLRVCQHKEGIGGQFTSKYNCYYLVYYECIPRIIDAIAREKQLKHWRRSYKNELIHKFNPEWRDLFPDLEPYGWYF